MIVWLDIETTGVTPDRDLILEIACISDQGQRRWVIGYPAVIIESRCSPYVLSMHNDTGLIRQCAESEESMRSAEDDMLAWFELPSEPNKLIVLAGFSVHFDRSFLVAQMPTFAKHLSHRVFDVSSIRRFLETHPVFSEQAIAYNVDHPRPHKAIEDAQAAKDSYEFYRDLVTPKPR